MSRLVELKRIDKKRGTAEFAGGEDRGMQEKLKEYAERVAKYIPGEVLAFYMAAVQLILTKEGDPNLAFRMWTFAIVGLIAWIGTPFYLSRFTDNVKEKRVNQFMGTAAFGIWAYAYPAGWFTERGWHDPVIAGLLLLGFTLASGFFQPTEVKDDHSSKREQAQG